MMGSPPLGIQQQVESDMSYKAHNRFLISASLIVIFAAVAIGVFQGTTGQRSAAAAENDRSTVNASISNGSYIKSLTHKATCQDDKYDPEPVSMLMLGIGLTGFAYGARRHFTKMD